MGVFDGYLICTDCDGTLTDSKQQISDENAAAIRHFQQEGGLFTVSTGRFPQHILNFKEKFWPNTYQVVGNGTTLYDMDHERVLHQVELEPPREALAFVVEQGLCDLIYVDHLTYSNGWNRADAGRDKKRDSLEGLFSDWEDLLRPNPDLAVQQPWHKINFCFTDPDQCVRVQHLMQEKFPQYKFERSWATGMELLPREGGKGPAVMRLRQMLGERVHTVVCVGDYENDVSMLQVADIGYAVANASQLCLQAADRVTVSHNESAIAVIIAELEKEIVGAKM